MVGLEKEWVSCEDCKHHYWKHGHMWTCKKELASCTVAFNTNLVQCAYFTKREENK